MKRFFCGFQPNHQSVPSKKEEYIAHKKGFFPVLLLYCLDDKKAKNDFYEAAQAKKCATNNLEPIGATCGFIKNAKNAKMYPKPKRQTLVD